MDMKQLLGRTELFRGLSDRDLDRIKSVCKEKSLTKGDIFAAEGEPGHQMCIIKDGSMEIVVSRGDDNSIKTITHLGIGQLIGEMSLVDRGKRSATVKALQTPTTILVIDHQDLLDLCEMNTQIGYRVMKNMAADLSFKLRHSSFTV